MKKLFLKKGKKKEGLSKSSILYKDFGIKFHSQKAIVRERGPTTATAILLPALDFLSISLSSCVELSRIERASGRR
jgi:hypothetical protein